MTALGVALALAVGLLASQRALAQRTVVVVRAAQVSPATEEVLAEVVASEMRARGLDPVAHPFDLVRERLKLGVVRRAELSAFEQAGRVAASAWKAYLGTDAVFAEARLIEARRALEPVLHLPGALDVLADISLRLAAVRLFAGRAQRARDVLDLAARLDHEHQLVLFEFSPEMARAYEGAQRARLTQAKSARLAVAEPVGALIEVDGEPVGVAPVAVPVAPGEHVLIVRKKGFLASGQLVAVGAADAPVRVELFADPALGALDGAADVLSVGAAAEQVARVLGFAAELAEADAVWLLASTWRRGEPTLLGQTCAAVPFRCGPVMEVRYRDARSLEALRAAVSTLVEKWRPPSRGHTTEAVLLEDTRLVAPEPPDPTRTGAPEGGPSGGRGGKKHWWESPWVWAGAGVAAIAAGGVWLWVGDGSTQPTVTIGACTFGGLCPGQ